MSDEFLNAGNELVDTLKERYAEWSGVKQFDGTESRLSNLWEEFCWKPERIKDELSKVFKVFDHTFEEMVVVGPIDVIILCPHHMMPCALQVVVGYVPNGEGKVLGLSKFVRIADIMGRRPILQEQYCQELVNEIEVNLKPKGVAVYATGTHGCMAFRGVRQRVPVIASIVRGTFKEPVARSEFLSLAERLYKTD